MMPNDTYLNLSASQDTQHMARAVEKIAKLRRRAMSKNYDDYEMWLTAGSILKVRMLDMQKQIARSCAGWFDNSAFQ